MLMASEATRLRWAVRAHHWAPTHAEFEYLLSLLPPEERPQVVRFRDQKDRQRALVSRLLQRRAAAAALRLPPAAVDLRRTRGGKPYVANALPKPHAPNWNFSVSHEGDYVILASEPVCICGCDVAAPRVARRTGKPAEPLAEWLRSFESQFTPREWAWIQGAGDDEAQETNFRKLWCLKEAFVKANGEGLGFKLGLLEFDIDVDGNTATVSIRGEPAADWVFHLHELGQGHWAAVARAPLSAVVDAWGGFVATFQQTAFAPGEWQAMLAVPEPAFTILSVADLLPEEARPGYEAAGGDLI